MTQTTRQIEIVCQNKKTTKIDRLLIWYKTMVQQVEKSFHQIEAELQRWRKILEVPYQRFKLAES